ncbi:glycosyl hydrolase [Paenibacillus xanthanilyticus]|uniref:glucan endo-1,3-beta-D-glucosidase n=1 Tax=Paenibacillus xanthanilyticus TaxID=1783531 RepID=A0ABV8K8F8_9BACL
MKKVSIYLLLVTLLATLLPAQAGAFNGEVPLGSGSYSTVLPPGATNTQSTIFKTGNVSGPMPTNDWWSNLAWDTYSEAQYPHPLAVKNQSDGFRIYYPGNRITANSSCVCGWINDIHDFTVGHTAVATFPDAKVDGFSDWFVKANYQSGSSAMNVSYGHGSPYVYFNFTGGNPKLSFYTPPTVWSGSASTPVLGITMEGAHYGLFGANGSTWSGIGSKTLTNNGSSYFSVAVLPDNTQATLNKFAQYAYSHVTGTQVSYAFNAAASQVTTTYTYTTQAKQGSQSGTIFALYPHQWKNSSKALLPYTYNSVRGAMKAAEGTSFQTSMKFTGVLPTLPDKGSYNKTTLQQYVNEAEAETYTGTADTYWVGKRLGKLATLAPIADQVGDATAATKFRNEIKSILQNWFKASDAAGNLKSQSVFYYNSNWGTVIGYPASYGSSEELNDHHFHYGYFIKAAAEVARVDKSWAQSWGPMVNLLIRDIANTNRSDSMFPYLRNFDPYAGHSWAAGHARFGDGNNNESSSEGMNAWAGMVLWGQATGDTAVRDAGIALYTTEMNAINEYWFDVANTNRPASFTRSTASMVWGGKTVGDGTWWTGNPEEVHGINWLPFTSASLYLTHYPTYTNKNYTALVSENGGTNFDAWEDLIYMYRAISNPTEAKNFWSARGAALGAEAGNSKANAYHWIYNLDAMGNADPTITANTPLYAVFNKNGVKTYIAYNMTNSPITVTFSDGTVVNVPANSFNTGNGGGGGGGGGGGDTQAPSVPTNLASTKTSTSVTLTWNASTDNVGVTGYDVYRGGALVGSTASTSYTDNGLAAGTAYSYTLRAKDAAGNVSAASAAHSVTTNASSGQYVTADFTATVTKPTSSSEKITFKPTTAALYVDIHYTVNGANQQNVRMTNNNGTWEHTINGLSAGQAIDLWFTYEKSGPQYDSPHYTYTH